VNLANELTERHTSGQLPRFLKSLAQKDLLIQDEMGYVPTSKKSSELLFSVISTAYEHQSLIITSNLELGRWNEMFGDDRLTHALIDRLVHHAHILAFSGESYRYKEALSKRSLKLQ
jgi:DNA replication protein DnaC